MVASERLQVVVCDRTRLSAELVCIALGQDTDIKAEHFSPECVVETAERIQPEVAVLSYVLSGVAGRGVELLKKVFAISPKTRAIVLLDDENASAVIDCLQNGARGVFCRSHSPEMLVRCVKVVRAGQVWINATELDLLLAAMAGGPRAPNVDGQGISLLSPREQEVISCMGEGMTNREIAETLRLSENTVKNHIYRIFDKLGVCNRVEAVMHAAAQHTAVPAKPPTRIHSVRPWTAAVASLGRGSQI